MLEGGIRIERQTWLGGFPPRIRFRGDTSTSDAVPIDGREATLSPDGSYRCLDGIRPASTPFGARAAREHTRSERGRGLGAVGCVHVVARRARYSRHNRARRSAACSCARQAARPTAARRCSRIKSGADRCAPGRDRESARPASDVRAGLCVGFPWFEPIWAIPAMRVHCDKRTARVLLIGPRPGSSALAQPGARRTRAAH